jgi:hypothetical protein
MADDNDFDGSGASDVGAKDLLFGFTGLGLMALAAILLAILT